MFRSNEHGRRIAYDARELEANDRLVRHSCPRSIRPEVFTEAMADFSKPFQCRFSKNEIYAVPTIRGVVWFNKLLPWTIHSCADHRDGFPEIWNYPEQEMIKRAGDVGTEIEPAVICCVKELLPGRQTDRLKHLVALKTVTGEKRCAIFEGDGHLKLGDLAVLSRDRRERRLLTVDSSVIFEYDEVDKPEHLHLPRNWLQEAA